MKNFLMNNTSLFQVNNNRLKKKSHYFQKVTSIVLELESLLDEKQHYKKLNFFFKSSSGRDSYSNQSLPICYAGVIVLYSISFFFSAINTFFCVTDALGCLKFSSSAGLVGFKGKSKKSRFQILKLFFLELRKLKFNFLRKNPVSLNLNNVGSYKRFIIRKLKRKFFIKIIKNYQVYAYNGCRKKKKIRK